VQLAIVNGPNLNLLGKREPDIYGNESFDTFLSSLREKFSTHEIVYFQSNVEGELINFLQHEGFSGKTQGIVLNAAGYSHTSMAIADTVKAVPIPVVAVHISNIFAREKERHTDLIAAHAKAMICGMGLQGYELALEHLIFLQKGQ
jgi:3-dehydroquinate dehydratase-2